MFLVTDGLRVHLSVSRPKQSEDSVKKTGSKNVLRSIWSRPTELLPLRSCDEPYLHCCGAQRSCYGDSWGSSSKQRQARSESVGVSIGSTTKLDPFIEDKVTKAVDWKGSIDRGIPSRDAIHQDEHIGSFQSSHSPRSDEHG